MTSNEKLDSASNSLKKFYSNPVVGITGTVATIISLRGKKGDRLEFEKFGILLVERWNPQGSFIVSGK